MRRAIPAGTVLVDIVCFEPFNFQGKGTKNRFGSVRYAAWLVPAAGEGEIQVVDLGETDPIDKLVVQARQEIQHRGPVLMPSAKKPESATAAPDLQIAATPASSPAKRGLDQDDVASTEGSGTVQALAKLIFAPLEEHLGRATKLIISPDASLWLVPWGRYRWLIIAMQLKNTKLATPLAVAIWSQA